MGLFHRVSAAQQAALEAVHMILEQENAVLDRKKLDSVQITPRGIRIKSWGFDAEESERKHLHSLEVLLDQGLVVVDCGTVHDGTLMGCSEAYLEIRAVENGGFEGISAALASRLPDYECHTGFWGSSTLRAHTAIQR